MRKLLSNLHQALHVVEKPPVVCLQKGNKVSDDCLNASILGRKSSRVCCRMYSVRRKRGATASPVPSVAPRPPRLSQLGWAALGVRKFQGTPYCRT